MDIQFFGATRQVTGSCYLLRVGKWRILLECGLFQGSDEEERRNSEPFPFEPTGIDAVVLSHAHLDHSGRLPLLIKRGYNGPIYTQRATADLCSVLLEDAGYLNEKEVEWKNRKRERKGLELLEPLYTREDARQVQEYFQTLKYAERQEILPGVSLILHDAGHILGSAIVELELAAEGQSRRLVFSGDLGHRGAPILRKPETVREADLVILESTYGDRRHRDWKDTWREMGEIISSARSGRGNILIPAFAVGRTQALLYAFREHYEAWGLNHWRIFLDSPMGIESTEVYARHANLYNAEARETFKRNGYSFNLPNLTLSRRSEDSMQINDIDSGAIVIAGSGMCDGGRIKHHLKHNVWRDHAHVLIVGFQAEGTLGRALVDGAETVRLWGEEVVVRAKVHTIGGLSAHADQKQLLEWYDAFRYRPSVVLVHGEPEAMDVLAGRLEDEMGARVTCPRFGQRLNLLSL